MPGYPHEGRRAQLPPLMHHGPARPAFADDGPGAWAVLRGQPQFARLDPPRRPCRTPLLPPRSQE